MEETNKNLSKLKQLKQAVIETNEIDFTSSEYINRIDAVKSLYNYIEILLSNAKLLVEEIKADKYDKDIIGIEIRLEELIKNENNELNFSNITKQYIRDNEKVLDSRGDNILEYIDKQMNKPVILRKLKKINRGINFYLK